MTPKCDQQPLQALGHDLVVYSEIPDQKDVASIEEDMDRLTAWGSTRGIMLHPDKCEAIIIIRKC